MRALSITRSRPGGPFDSRALVLLGALMWLPLGALVVRLIGL